MGTHKRVLSESYLINTNMTAFKWFSKICVLVLWVKVALALKELGRQTDVEKLKILF